MQSMCERVAGSSRKSSRGQAQHQRDIRGKTKSREDCACSAELEPIATVGDPPAHDADWNCGEQRPPERQGQVGHQAQNKERAPKDLFLHAAILGPCCGVSSQTWMSIAKEPRSLRP